MPTTTSLTRSDLAGLAQRARNGQTTSVRALRELALAAGFTTRGGGVFDPAGDYTGARGWAGFGALIATSNTAGRAAADTILDFHAVAETSDADDVAGWSEGYPGSEMVAARQAATAGRNGCTARYGDAVRHVETGAWGIADEYREDHGLYVCFDGDEQWDRTLVRAGDIAVVEVPEGEPTLSRWDATCPVCAQIPPVDEHGRAARHLRRFGRFRPTYCAGRGREVVAHDRTGLQRAQLLDTGGRPLSITALPAGTGSLDVATIVLPGGVHVPVDPAHADGQGAELDRALQTAGYRPGHGWIAYDNLIDDGAALLVRPDTTPAAAGPVAAATGPGPVPDLSGYDVSGNAAEWLLSDHPWAIAERTRRRRAWADKEITDTGKILDWVSRTHANDTAGELDARPAGWRDNLVRLAELAGPMADHAQTRAAIEAAQPDTVWVAEHRRRHEIHRQIAGDDAYTYPTHLLGPGAAAYPPPGWTSA